MKNGIGTSLILLFASLCLVGCGGMAGNYNPVVDSAPVSAFFEVNQDEIGYLYGKISEKNKYTEAEKKRINRSIHTIESSVEFVSDLRTQGGPDYQSFKVNFKLSEKQYLDHIAPLVDQEMSRAVQVDYPDGEFVLNYIYERSTRIIYGNMVNRTNFFLTECNKIINAAEDEIDEHGWENLQKYGEGFYNSLKPLLDIAL